MKTTVLAAGMSLFALFAIGQHNVNFGDFRWDPSKSQELTWNQTIAKARLSRQERAELIATIKAQLQGEPSSAEDPSSQDLDQTEIEFVDLHRRGSHELIAHATGQYLCSPTGNCSLWVLRRDRKKYRVILEGTAQTFTIQPTVTNGWHDIVLGMHGSAFETQLTLYKFDGTEYSRSACEMAIFPGREETKPESDKVRFIPCG